jgi:hypothetical protein
VVGGLGSFITIEVDEGLVGDNTNKGGAGT